MFQKEKELKCVVGVGSMLKNFKSLLKSQGIVYFFKKIHLEQHVLTKGF
jgi:hypothetical protein